MGFTHFFIDRPIFAGVLSILILIMGLVAYNFLPVAQYPEIAPPTIVVRASYPGADAETVAATVATPIEQEINGVENMLYMSSYASADGTMTLTITFKLGTDLDKAQVLVQNRVGSATPRLPDTVRTLGVTTLKSSPDIMMVVHMISPDDTFDQLYISNYATLRVRDQLLRLDGVGDITVFGAREYSLRVWLDPDKLAGFALTATDIVAALREQNVQVAGGALGAQPASDSSAFQLIVTTQGRFSNAAQFRNVIVKATSDGRLIRVSDIARVELGAKDYVSNSYLSGKAAVALGVFQRPGTNALSAAKAIIDTMDKVKKDFPKGLDYQIAYNPTQFVADSISEVYRTLFEALALVVVVVLVFLQSWRTALIPIIAIPVSLVGTFAFMSVFGFSLNNLTLFGLVLAIGIVVDDAIVVVENAERHIAAGMSPRDASHRTMDDVGSAVVAIGLVLMAVFVPVSFVPGITGQFYRQFALTIAASAFISTFNSLTLSPALCAILLKPHSDQKPRSFIGRFGSGLASGFNRGFDATAHGYSRMVKGLVGYKLVLILMLCLYGGLLGGTYWILQKVPTGFIPSQDKGYAIVVVTLPSGASLTRTDAVVQRVQNILLKAPGIASTIAFAGLNGATFTSASNAAAIFVTFKPFDDRIASGDNSGKIIDDLNKRLQAVDEAVIFVVPPPPVSGVGNSGGFKMQVQDRGGAGIRPLLAATQDLIGKANGDASLSRVFTTLGADTPQIYLEIDRTKARMLNVPIASIFETLQSNLGTAYVNDFNAFGRVYQVRVQDDQQFRLERDSISQLKVRSSSGALVPLGTLVEIRDISGPDLVQHFNMYPSVPVQGAAKPGISTGQSLDAMEKIATSLPQGFGFEWTELAYQEKATGNTSIFIFALAVLLVFLVLAAQYESWTLPLAIVLIVPMGVLAAMVGVMIRAQDNNILTQVGLVVLISLSAKNAILIVEFARQQEEHGLDPVSAVVEAAKLRLRPILMTALAFILGVVPLVIAQGPGAEMRQALGTAVFSGMIGVTIFGLFLTPVFYVAIRLVAIRVSGGRKTPEVPASPSPSQPAAAA